MTTLTPVSELLKGCFINIDKPTGPTSHDIDIFMRRILGVEKTGHFGTLDPMVTGVLPIAVGKATRLLQYFEGGKEYVGVMHIHEERSKKEVEEMIGKQFSGVITQLPPVKSRVKRQEREREIYAFKIIEHDRNDFLFSVKCEAGTYVRKLVHDLGEALGCGAHMTELRRTKAGLFEEDTIVNLYDLYAAMTEYKTGNEEPLRMLIQPMEIITKDIKKISVKEDAIKRLSHGGPVLNDDLVKKIKLEIDEKIAVLFNDKIILTAKVVKEGDIFAKPENVFI